MEKILDMVNQNVQDALKKFEDTQEIFKTPKKKKLSWHRNKKETQDFNKYQSETKDTIKREICELKRTPQIIKEE
jgi:hypothetical protein